MTIESKPQSKYIKLLKDTALNRRSIKKIIKSIIQKKQITIDERTKNVLDESFDGYESRPTIKTRSHSKENTLAQMNTISKLV